MPHSNELPITGFSQGGPKQDEDTNPPELTPDDAQSAFTKRTNSKRAHTLVCGKIRNLIYGGGNFPELSTLEAELQTAGRNVRESHGAFLKALGTLSKDDKKKQEDWLNEIQTLHTEILNEIVAYRNPAVKPKKAKSLLSQARANSTKKSHRSSNRSKILPADAAILLEKEKERLRLEEAAAQEVDQQELKLKESKRKLEGQRRINEMEKTLDLQLVEDSDEDVEDEEEELSQHEGDVAGWILNLPNRVQPDKPVPSGKVKGKVPPVKPKPVVPSPAKSKVQTKAASWIQERSGDVARSNTSHGMLALLPKHHFTAFDGDPMKWPSFIATFKYLVHDVAQSDAQRLALLGTYLTTAVRDELGQSITSPDQYWNVLEELEELYGHPHLVAKAYMDNILSTKPIQDGDRRALLAYIQKLRGVATILKDNGYEHELHSGVTLGNLVAKLPGSVQSQWARFAVPKMAEEKRSLNISDLADWLKTISMAERLLDLSKPNVPNKPNPTNERKAPPRNLGRSYQNRNPAARPPSLGPNPTLSAAKFPKREDAPPPPRTLKCFCCGAPKHSMFRCEKFLMMSIPDRSKLVNNEMRCFCCLGSGHGQADCPSTFRCRIEGCNQRHNTLLHDGTARKDAAGPIKTTGPEPSARPHTYSALHQESINSNWTSQTALLAVVKLELSREGRRVQTFALLDPGSNGSLIREDVASQLKIPGRNRPIKFNTFHNQDPFIKAREANFDVGLPGAEPLFNVDAFTTPELNLDRRSLDWDKAVDRWPYLSQIPRPAVPNEDIGALIGMDVVRAHLQREILEPPEGAAGPYAIRTDLGWCVIGPVDDSVVHVPSQMGSTETSPSCFSIVADGPMDRSPDDTLQNLVLDFFKLESTGTTKINDEVLLSTAERRALDIAESTIRHDGPGEMYEIGLPLISDDETLPNNRCMAVKLLDQQLYRLQRQPELAKLYTEQMDQYEELGFSRKLSQEEIELTNPRTWYLTHHGVTNPSKPGRIRVVFNASATYKGTSLNKKLLPGPNLLNDLPGVLTRFREYPVAVSSDIVKFFHHVKVPLEDQSMLRYVWRRPGSTGPTETYCMTRQPFGSVSSPFLCLFALERAARDGSKDFPSASGRVVRNRYMDNYMDSFPTAQEAKRDCQDIITLANRAGLLFNEWSSNCKELLIHLPASDLVVPFIDLDVDPLPSGRMLGILYNPNSDTIGFKIRIRPEADTKRGILSEVASQYDPLGLLSPVTIVARVLLQDVWLAGTNWDVQVPPTLLNEWQQWAEVLSKVERLEIPRLLAPSPNDGIEVHAFADASEKAYGAVLYSRCVMGPDVSISIIASRAKVAPIKPLTIPKLELQAAVLATRLVLHYQREMRLRINSVTFWSDSETTLRRIWSQKCKFQVYEANRIGEIRESFNPDQFRHVPGVLNPADDLTRGVDASLLDLQHRWFAGPPFLSKGEEEWPATKERSEPIDDPSVKPHRWISATGPPSPTPLTDFVSGSKSLISLKRVMALVIRFINKCKRKKTTAEDIGTTPAGPKVSEMERGLNACFILAQQECFWEELDALTKKKPVHPDSRLSTLSPFIDKNGVMRVGGRFKRAHLPYHAKHPVILDSHHQLTRLIIEYYHEIYCHSSVERLLGEIRQRYLIMNARRTIRNILSECLPCKKAKSTPQVPFMADLPVERTSIDYPFTWTGTDYFGPMYVKQGRATVKRYGVLFTCLSTRAVHLEVAHSLTQDSFLNAYRRFVALRGRPRSMFSDNGSNLTAGERELRDALDEWEPEKLERYMANKGTTWTFSPPSAPHFGGVWESLVKSCKRSLRAILNNETVSDEILQTVMGEVAGLLNGRPLTHVSVDPEDLEPITPNHFLLGRPQPDLPPAPFTMPSVVSKRQWRVAQSIVDQFWKRWMKEYVPTLVHRKKWLKQNRNFIPDDLVLVIESNTPRGSWPLGRIVRSMPGPDGVVRVVDVRTKTGVYTRPVSKLCLLVEAKPTES